MSKRKPIVLMRAFFAACPVTAPDHSRAVFATRTAQSGTRDLSDAVG
jgi:hypothetical protein